MQSRHSYGYVEGAHPRVWHMHSSMSGRAKCGKPIVLIPGRPPEGEAECDHCHLFDNATMRPKPLRPPEQFGHRDP